MRITFLTATRVPDVPSPLLVEVAGRLRGLGHDVRSVTPEKVLTDLDGGVACGGRSGAEMDLLAGAEAGGDALVVLKSHTELALSLAADLADRGVRCLNPLESCAAAQDKVRAHRRLRQAGVPVPATWVTGSWAAVRTVHDGRPLLVKPVRGHRGAGVEVVRDPDQLAGRPDPATPLLVQELVEGPGEDLKVYVVGEQVWAVRKPFSATSFTLPGRPVPVGREVREIALRAGEATGLGVYGLDVIESPAGPVVVDLNYFPGYKGCVGVAGPMADYVHAYAAGSIGLRLPAVLEPVGA